MRKVGTWAIENRIIGEALLLLDAVGSTNSHLVQAYCLGVTPHTHRTSLLHVRFSDNNKGCVIGTRTVERSNSVVIEEVLLVT